MSFGMPNDTARINECSDTIPQEQVLARLNDHVEDVRHDWQQGTLSWDEADSALA